MVEARVPVRSAIRFRSILSRQNGMNRHMEQTKCFLAENPVFQFFALKDLYRTPCVWLCAMQAWIVHKCIHLQRGATTFTIFRWQYSVPKKAKTAEKLQNQLVHKNCCFIILNGIWEVWGCPGGWHGPYEEIVSNFGRVWSYRTWGKSSFIYFFEILETHFITKYLQTSLRILRFFLKPGYHLRNYQTN